MGKVGCAGSSETVAMESRLGFSNYIFILKSPSLLSTILSEPIKV
jgi:hypothetical protein